jgi:DNA (cytosine-5)-methyltransferase 1
MPRAVSLFSGCGGFDWGVQQAGVEIIWANDIDPRAATAYQSLFPNVDFVLNDICNIQHFPQAEVLIGCYPCTGFSVAARRRHKNLAKRDLFENENNFLYTQYLRAVQQVQPRYIFIENVRGMAAAHDGWFLKNQIDLLKAMGYRVQHQTLDASFYGVPQSRKRIFIVGVHESVVDFTYEYPQPTHGPKGTQRYKTLRDILEGQEFAADDKYLDYKFHGHYLTRQRKRGWDDPGYTVVADAHHVTLHPSGEPMRYVAKDTWELQGDVNRRLSWRECMAIQELPQHMVIDGGLEAKYRVVGNAVPPKFGQILLEPVIAFERANN